MASRKGVTRENLVRLGVDRLAATILLRSMIDFSLDKARSSRCRHAARHLDRCGELAVHIEDWKPLQPHTRSVETLRSEHGRKTGFWRWVGDPEATRPVDDKAILVTDEMGFLKIR